MATKYTCPKCKLLKSTKKGKLCSDCSKKRTLQIDSDRKDFMKENFSSLKKSELEGDEKRYYQLIANGKKSAKNNPKINGKYLSGELLEMVKKVSANKGISPVEYVKQNKSVVENMVDVGYSPVSVSVENLVDIIDNNKRKYVYINDGNGYHRVENAEAALRLVMFQQFIVSNYKVVWMGINTRFHSAGRIDFNLPDISQLEDMSEDEIFELLDEMNIEYGTSGKNAEPNQ